MNKGLCIRSGFKNKSSVYSHCLALESRMVFDGAVVATAAEIQDTASDNHSANGSGNEAVGVVADQQPASESVPIADFLPENTVPVVDYLPSPDTAPTSSEFFTAPVNPPDSDNAVTETNTVQATTIIVVDSRAEQATSLSLNPPANTQVILLDSTHDGFQQVAELLQTQQDVTELHVLPWTQNQQQWLGSQLLTATVEPTVSSSLLAWDNGLADNAQLVFHGENSLGVSWLAYVGTLTDTQTSWSVNSDFSQDNSISPGSESSATTIYFIDSAVQDTADIISAIDDSAEIVYLDANKDGLSQVADYLDGRTNIDSVQIISHGNQATLYLGNDILTNDNLSSHAEQLSVIGQSLTASGDILFYGCDLAKSIAGSQFIDSFSYFTQADVAASTDLTGAANKGGNWALEYTTGTIEASILAASHYQNLLAVTTVTSVAITSNAGADNSYTTGDVVTASVVFSGIEDVTGTPTLTLNIGGQLRAATYSGGTGTNTLQFSYTIVAGDTDGNGISINTDSLALNGGTINNANFAATLYHAALIDNNLQMVASTLDTTVPVLKSAVANGTNLTLTYTETGSGLSTISAPLPSDFVVTRNNGELLTVTAVSVNSVAQTVDLTLGSVINPTDSNILVSYAATGGRSIHDNATNPAADLSNAPVTNTMPTFDLKGGRLSFNSPTSQVVNGAPGTGGQTAGDIVLFSNVVTLDGQAIDAIVTTVDNTRITIPGFDTASGNIGPITLDPHWFELLASVTNPLPAGLTGSSTIKFDFIKHGTYNAGTGVNVLLQNVIVNSYDLDNSQFQEFGGFASYTVAGTPNPTLLTQENLSSNFSRFNAPVATDSSAFGSAAFDRFRVSALYDEINSFQIKTGSKIAGDAYFFLDFSGGPTWNSPVSYQIPTVNPLTTNDFTPTITGTYEPTVTGSTDTAQSLSVTVNGVTYTNANGLSWSGGIWSLTLPFTPPNTYDVIVDTGYGQTPATITAHTLDATLNELTIVNNPPVNTVPGTQQVNAGVQTPITGLSVTDIDANLTSSQITVTNGVLNIAPTAGVTITGNGTNTVTLTLLPGFTESQIQTALATLNYTGAGNDTLTIISTDSLGAFDTDTVNILVGTAPPITVNDTATGNTGVPVTVDVTFNDSDPDGNLDITSVKIVDPANPNNRLDQLVVSGQGIWSINPANGQITFQPAPGFKGNPTPIRYTVKDTGGLESAAATVTVNYPPPVNSDTATGIGGNPVTIDILGNDGGLGVNLNPASVQIVGTTTPGASLFVPNQGTWSVNTTTGAITFTPVPGFKGSPTPISYTVKDTFGLESASATVSVIMNTIPIAANDTNTATEGGSTVTGDIIANEIALGDEPTFVTSASQGGKPITIGSAFTTAAGGILILNADGSYSYTPPRTIQHNGLIEQFNYTITDTNGDTSSSVLTIVITSPPLTSGSLIQLSNPASPITAPSEPFFVAQPIEPATLTVLDLSLYIQTPDDIVSLTGSLRDQVVLELRPFSFDIPRWSFSHTKPNEQLVFDATYPDGSALPEWLRFNPKLLRFSGIPPKGAHDEAVMVTATDSYGNEVHAIFTVHVNKERIRPDHKALKLDLKLMDLPNKVLEKNQHKDKVAKAGLSERMNMVGKLGKLQESRALLNSLKTR